MLRVLALPLGGLLLGGCGFGSDTPGTSGQLGEGQFTYECEDPSGDPVCNEGSALDRSQVEADLGRSLELPRAVAVGAIFDVRYTGDVTTDDFDRLSLTVESSNTEEVQQASDGFVIDAPGRFPFLARDREERIVADFTYLTAAEPDALELWHDGQPVTSIDMTEGTDTDLAAISLDAEGHALAGSLEFQWTSSDESIAAVDKIGTIGAPGAASAIRADEVRLVARGAGQANLTVSAAGLLYTVSIDIAPEVTP
jgi:hypothetical protein